MIKQTATLEPNIIFDQCGVYLYCIIFVSLLKLFQATFDFQQGCGMGEPLCHNLAVFIDHCEHCLVDWLLICIPHTLCCCKCVVHAPESALDSAYVAVSPVNGGPHRLQPDSAEVLAAGLKAGAQLEVLGRISCWAGPLLQLREQRWNLPCTLLIFV